MSRLLLDTHVWLWALGSPTRLSEGARNAIREADAIVLSVASIWEVGVKHALGKLPLTEGVRPLISEAVRALGAHVLPIATEHVLVAAELPLHHRDPFDRVLVAQARCEGLTLVSADAAVRAYNVALLWAEP